MRGSPSCAITSFDSSAFKRMVGIEVGERPSACMPAAATCAEIGHYRASPRPLPPGTTAAQYARHFVAADHHAAEGPVSDGPAVGGRNFTITSSPPAVDSPFVAHRFSVSVALVDAKSTTLLSCVRVGAARPAAVQQVLILDRAIGDVSPDIACHAPRHRSPSSDVIRRPFSPDTAIWRRFLREGDRSALRSRAPIKLEAQMSPARARSWPGAIPLTAPTQVSA